MDGITAERVNEWDSITEQVTQTQLDEAISAEAAERKSAFEYLQEICLGLLDEFKNIYGAIGVTVYDGGYFTQEQSGITLDGGGFTDEIMGTVDCGGFEPLMMTAEAGAVVDGGNY